MTRKTIEDLENDGFEIYSQSEKNSHSEDTRATKASHKGTEHTDNLGLLEALANSNLAYLQVSEMSAKSFHRSISNLIGAMENRPDSFELEIERDARGFMKRVKVKVSR